MVLDHLVTESIDLHERPGNVFRLLLMTGGVRMEVAPLIDGEAPEELV